ncbi:energy transducer TonB [Cytophagaceae bacterium YF14B1]|uniref:Energy transducer TonB n=1 Tax=Xanthocytophaga flava TaxID=3048013 RepID=A0AAE3QLP1_9BACT|nr:energy transducer TonB [Xanthocytophaga flavus]MDJ1479380.1 energy transducer TonB [Xanthocytophaga flavus]
MKYKFIIYLSAILISNKLTSQNIDKALIGSWVKLSANFQNGDDLPLDHPVRQNYVRFDFNKKGNAYKTTNPLDKGYMFKYQANGNNLKIGFINYMIKRLSSDTLVLVEEGRNGFDNSAIMYSLTRESLYQKKLPLLEELLIVRDSDTLYIENEKIRARFEKDESFHEYLRKGIPEYSNVVSSDNFFMATFIVDQNGKIDSIKIHKSLNKSFDKQFIKAVNSSSGYWEPAQLNGKNVNILHTETFTFITNPNFEKQYYNYKNGVIEMQKGNYDNAIKLFNITLSSNPNDIDALYQRGICYYKIGMGDKACVDWLKIRALKSKRADDILIELCK